MFFQFVLEYFQHPSKEKSENHVSERVARSRSCRCTANVLLSWYLKEGIQMDGTENPLGWLRHARLLHRRLIDQMLLKLVENVVGHVQAGCSLGNLFVAEGGAQGKGPQDPIERFHKINHQQDHGLILV
jgi:hypothetical protein